MSLCGVAVSRDLGVLISRSSDKDFFHMFNRALALRSTTEVAVRRKGILNVIDHVIEIQCATASLVPPVAINQGYPVQWSKARILAGYSHNVHDTACDH